MCAHLKAWSSLLSVGTVSHTVSFQLTEKILLNTAANKVAETYANISHHLISKKKNCTFLVPGQHDCFCSRVMLDLWVFWGENVAALERIFFPPLSCLHWGVIGTGRSPRSFPFTMHYTCLQLRQMRERWWEKGMRVRVEKKIEGKGQEIEKLQSVGGD